MTFEDLAFQTTVYPGRCAIHQSSNLASRIRNRMMFSSATTIGRSKFADVLAREEQRRLAEEIKDCKSCVKNLESSLKMRRINSKGEDDSSNHSTSRRSAFARFLARDDHASSLSDEIQYYEQELKEEQAKAAMVSSKCLSSSVRRGSSLQRVVHHHHRQGHDLHRS